jgi:hypothetical protein
MKKFLIPGIVLALGIAVAGTYSVSAASLTSTQIIAKSDTDIATRIASLNKIITKVSGYKHLTTDQKASITATVQASITEMNILKTKIDGETDIPTLKSDYDSITKDYRIYMVVVPNAKVLASTDTAMADITTYQSSLASLNTRIAAASATGKNVTAIEGSAADATAKLTDAQTQSQNLVTAVTSLKVDNGDKTVEATNKAQLASVKTAGVAMKADISATAKDIASIRTGLKALKI